MGKLNKEGLKKFWSSSKERLLCLYIDEKLSQPQIADKFGISPTAVENYFKKLNINRRTNGQSQTARNFHRVKKLTYRQEQLIFGSLLGDSCIGFQKYKSNKTNKIIYTYKINFYHSTKFKDYLLHKHKYLGMGVKIKKPYKLYYKRSGKGSLMVGFSFCHTPTLRIISEICYNRRHKKLVTDKWLNKLTWMGIAYWFQDDGSISITKNTKRSISLHTSGFSLKEIKKLQKLLKNKFTVDSTLARTNKKEQFKICISKKDHVKFFIKKIRPYIIPCMKYKIRRFGNISEHYRR